MSHRHAKWFREADAQRPLYKLTCHHPGCDYVVLTADPYLSKVHHQSERHYGHPWSFSETKWKQAETETQEQPQ